MKDLELYEEHFEDKGKRSSRKQRKYLQQSDRSQYKKTDQKPKETSEAFILAPDQQKGQVLSIVPEGMLVETASGQYIAQLRGSFKKKKDKSKNLIAVGDFVVITPLDATSATIDHILPRFSVLSRADNLSRKKEQLIAVNVDIVIIMASLSHPELKSNLIDRYLIAAKIGGLHPIVVINKFDLDVDKTLAEKLKASYEAIDIPTFFISTTTGLGIEALAEFLQGKTSVISGQSGVGKSSLLSLFTQNTLKVGDIVERTQKGSHTTTVAQMIPLTIGGYCIDTPGIRSFGIWDLAKDQISGFFPEIFAIGHDCRYVDCTHQEEPGCAVNAAVLEGRIPFHRFSSYLCLVKEMDEKHRNR